MSFSRQPARCQVLAISIFALFLGVCASAQSEATPPDGKPATKPRAGDPSAAVQWGTVKGKVIVDGEVSVPPIFRKGDMKVKDPDVCAANDIPDESLIVDPATSGLANVVIYLKKKPEHIHPLLKGAANVQLQFLAKGCRYSPHIMVSQVGQTVIVISADPVAHNTRGTPVRNNQFGQTVAANDRNGTEVVYRMTEKNPFPVSCDFHNWMRAHWLVTDHPYHAVTATDGSFEIKHLPAGEHELIIWHERVGYLFKNVRWNVKEGENQLPDYQVPAKQLLMR